MGSIADIDQYLLHMSGSECKGFILKNGGVVEKQGPLKCISSP